MDAHTAAFALGDYDHSQPLVIDPVLTYSSYFGGNYGDTGWAIAVNTNDGSIYVAGQTFSTKNTNNPLRPDPDFFHSRRVPDQLRWRHTGWRRLCRPL